MGIAKRKKYGVIISIIVFFILLAIAFIPSIETNKEYYERTGKFDFALKNPPPGIKQINYNYNNVDFIYIWLIGIIIIFVTMYVAFVKRKEKDINKVQMVVLATIIPIVLFISFLAAIQLLDISTLADAWFFTVVTLILIAIFEYDLFGNKTIISFFDFKLLIKIIILSTILFFIIGLLGELIPRFT